jgi:pimeloyl-ACP methyl ester carboxylesterase
MLPMAHFWNSRLWRWAIMLPLARRRPPDAVLDTWFEPATHQARIRRDLTKLLRAATPRATITAAKRLRAFPGPALIVWTASENLIFPLRHAHRLQRLLSGAELELIEQSRAFSPEDQPERLAELIDRFASSTSPRRRSGRSAVASPEIGR